VCFNIPSKQNSAIDHCYTDPRDKCLEAVKGRMELDHNNPQTPNQILPANYYPAYWWLKNVYKTPEAMGNQNHALYIEPPPTPNRSPSPPPSGTGHTRNPNPHPPTPPANNQLVPLAGTTAQTPLVHDPPSRPASPAAQRQRTQGTSPGPAAPHP
jgi:hypothetical protein